MEKPARVHVNAVKRVLKYIQGTTNMGILYQSGEVLDLVGYSDADYAGDVETRRSTWLSNQNGRSAIGVSTNSV